jgi:hypothetical protein
MRPRSVSYQISIQIERYQRDFGSIAGKVVAKGSKARTESGSKVGEGKIVKGRILCGRSDVPLGQVLPLGQSPFEGVFGTHSLDLSCHLSQMYRTSSAFRRDARGTQKQTGRGGSPLARLAVLFVLRTLVQVRVPRETFSTVALVDFFRGNTAFLPFVHVPADRAVDVTGLQGYERKMKDQHAVPAQRRKVEEDNRGRGNSRASWSFHYSKRPFPFLRCK